MTFKNVVGSVQNKGHEYPLANLPSQLSQLLLLVNPEPVCWSINKDASLSNDVNVLAGHVKVEISQRLAFIPDRKFAGNLDGQDLGFPKSLAS